MRIRNVPYYQDQRQHPLTAVTSTLLENMQLVVEGQSGPKIVGDSRMPCCFFPLEICCKSNGVEMEPETTQPT